MNNPAPSALAALTAALTAGRADAQNAAANYYLGYTIYKRVEKSAFHADKRRAARFFSAAFSADPRFRPDWGGKSR